MANVADYTHFTGGVNQFVTPVVGGTAGDLTLTGITTDDKLVKVYAVTYDTDGDAAAVADRTSEFSITAADTINNTGGTSTADAMVFVTWVDVDL